MTRKAALTDVDYGSTAAGAREHRTPARCGRIEPLRCGDRPREKHAAKSSSALQIAGFEVSLS